MGGGSKGKGGVAVLQLSSSGVLVKEDVDNGAAVVTPINVHASAPRWLSHPSRAAVDTANEKGRAAALKAVKGDESMGILVRQAFDEAERITHAMAGEATRTSRSRDGARFMALRGLPALASDSQNTVTRVEEGDVDRDGGKRYATLYTSLLARVARATLQLLPLPRMRFDLAAYWAHPMATSLLEAHHVATLLHSGSVVLRGAFPEPMVRQVGVEIASFDFDLSASTVWTHERSIWVSSPDEAPPHAPTPEPVTGKVPPELYGVERTVEPTAQPALCGAMRGLRGLAAALEGISELRLATPRGALLREVLDGGCQAHGPINSGWPDTGVEVACTLGLFHPQMASLTARAVAITSRGKRKAIKLGPGDILLTLARQARVDVPAAPPVASSNGRETTEIQGYGDGGGNPGALWLTLPFYSTNLRSAADGRMLGVSKEAIAEMVEKRNRGELRQMPNPQEALRSGRALQ